MFQGARGLPGMPGVPGYDGWSTWAGWVSTTGGWQVSRASGSMLAALVSQHGMPTPHVLLIKWI